jgi:hypothetical protein
MNRRFALTQKTKRAGRETSPPALLIIACSKQVSDQA